MVSVKIVKSTLNGEIRCPSSKSYTHRAIVISSLAEGRSLINYPLYSRDTLATVDSCKLLGVNIAHNENHLEIDGKFPFSTPDDIINAENSGTTIRLLTSLSAHTLNGYSVLTGDHSLRKRPMKHLLNALHQLGVTCFSTKENGTPPIVVKGGGIKGGSAVIDGSVSSQFISSLLISSVYADSDVYLKVEGSQVSKPYILSTIETMKAFGVSISFTENFSEYVIPQQRYLPTFFEVPSDFSSVALLLSAGILVGNGIRITNINFDLPQADSKIIEIITHMGGNINVNKERKEIYIYPSETLDGGEYDLTDCPDLLPVVSILSLKARSSVRIYGISHARYKETDRVHNICMELEKLGAIVKEKHDELLIYAPKELKNAHLDSYGDHRLFMAFCIASMLTDMSLVSGAESVDVSYPNFLHDIKNLGGNYSILSER